MTGATVSRWTRRFVAAGVAWFVCSQVAVATGGGRRVAVTLGLYGFVLHVLFGKAYALEAVALVGFAAAYLDLFVRSDRRRIGLYVVGAAVVAGGGLAVLGFALAFVGFDPAVANAHARVALLGFLGLAIVGVSYQFYPPSGAEIPGVDDRTAGAAAVLLLSGLALEVDGLLAENAAAVAVGRWLAVLGALLYATVLVAVFAEH